MTRKFCRLAILILSPPLLLVTPAAPQSSLGGPKTQTSLGGPAAQKSLVVPQRGQTLSVQLPQQKPSPPAAKTRKPR